MSFNYVICDIFFYSCLFFIQIDGLVEIDEMTYAAMVDKFWLHSTMQDIKNYIKSLLWQPWFAHPSKRAPNSTVTYTWRQRRLPHMEHEDVVGPSQPAPTLRTWHRNDDEAGPSQQQTTKFSDSSSIQSRKKTWGWPRKAWIVVFVLICDIWRTWDMLCLWTYEITWDI